MQNNRENKRGSFSYPASAYQDTGILLDLDRKNQTENVQNAKHSTVGVNIPAMTSAYACIGALSI
jgi:hypothetical protein